MAKVEGSNPFIRFRRISSKRALFQLVTEAVEIGPEGMGTTRGYHSALELSSAAIVEQQHFDAGAEVEPAAPDLA